MIIAPEKPAKSSLPAIAPQINSKDEQYFSAQRYLTNIKLYPNKELCLRFQTRIKRYHDKSEDIVNKYLAKSIENEAVRVGEGCLLSAKKDIKKENKAQKKGWGLLPSPKKFTKKVSKRICRALNSVEKKFGKNNLRFLTMTLPGSTEAAIKTMSAYSAYVTNRISTWLGDILGEYRGFKVAVWELQSRGALHLHAVVGHPNKEVLEKIDFGFKKFCYRMFQQISKKSGIDMFERFDGTTWKDNPEVLRCNSEVVRKSVASYMSKYLTKTERNYSQVSESNLYIYYPSRWTSCGRKISQLIMNETVEFKQRCIDKEDAEHLAKVCLKYADDWCPKGYKPLIYKDKVGGGINFKMFIKPEKMAEAERILRYWFDYLWEEKSPSSGIVFPSVEEAQSYELKKDTCWLMRQEIIEKYGKCDDRLWQKQFRLNSHPVPGFEDMYKNLNH